MLRLPVLRAVLGCICCLVGSGALVASIPFFLEVSPFLHVATELDAAESFERLNSSCRVLSIRRCWSSTPDALEPSAPQSERDPAGQPHCWLSYRARFTRSARSIYRPEARDCLRNAALRGAALTSPQYSAQELLAALCEVANACAPAPTQNPL